MPPTIQDEHERWQRTRISIDEMTRAHTLALAILDAGDEPDAVEHQLVALGVGDATAADNARRLGVDSSAVE